MAERSADRTGQFGDPPPLAARGRLEFQPGLDGPLGLRHGVRDRRALDDFEDGPGVPVHAGVPCRAQWIALMRWPLYRRDAVRIT